MVVVLFHRHLKIWHQELNDNSGIQFADQETIIIDLNIVQIQTCMPIWNYFRFSGTIFNFGVNESSVKVGMGTIEKLTREDMSIAVIGMLGLSRWHRTSDTPVKYHCNTRVNITCILFSLLGKLAERAIYFTFHNFFFFTMSKAISVSTGPIFTIFSPNGRYLREFS